MVQSDTVIDVGDEKFQCFVVSAVQELKQFYFSLLEVSKRRGSPYV